MSENIADAEEVDEKVDAGNDEAEQEGKLKLTYEVADVRACRKRVTITIPRSQIESSFDKEFSELTKSEQVPGFRPGKAPRKLIERRYRKGISDRVKIDLMLKSMDQVGVESKLQPLSPADIDPASVTLPEEGDFVFQFEVEVPPDFELPNYKALKVNRPTREFTESDIDAELQQFLRRFGKLETKSGPAEKGDYIIADIRFLAGKEVLQEFEDMTVRVDQELYFRDGHIEKFADAVVGVQVGESRELKAKLSGVTRRADLRDREIDAVFVIKEIKKVPPIDQEFLERIGMSDIGELRDYLRATLQERLAGAQIESYRQQIINALLSSTQFDLPEELLERQAANALEQRVLELRQAGYSQEDIMGVANRLRQNINEATRLNLRSRFILSRIASEEKIEVNDEDLTFEIKRIAAQSQESARRVRAQLEKDGSLEMLNSLALERKTLEKILSYATLTDVPYQTEERGATGIDAEASPEEPEKPEDEAKAEAESKSEASNA